MGRPEADSSSYDGSVHNDPSQSQYGDTPAYNPQDQQPPQANQGYGGQPAQPSQFPPQGPQTNPMYSTGPSRPAPYQPQANPTQPAPYQPQANPTQPAPYQPHASPTQPAPYQPQANPTQPAPYPPPGQQKFQNQPAQFPPQNPMEPAAYPPQGPQMNPMYNNGPNQPANFPPQGPQQMAQAFPPQAFQNPYQASPAQAQPQAGQFPPQGPVNGVPMQAVNQQQPGWTTGIFGCLEDPSNALITALFPCVTFGQVAEIVDGGKSSCATNGMMYGLVASCIGMPCLVSCGYRSKLRAMYGLSEDPAPDWLVHWIFEPCALCQEYRELKNRGLDPASGWHGNISRQNLQQAHAGMAPPMNQRMMP
ncbi:DUF614 FAMILY PROTEIN-RELATED [Salix purpurea]|uniref:DUF614 FAMILY PROTEIN-RELATED n=1 Tax=Salix purpurea TaxID=77065 RepID=A0A9Q0ZW98_SALPP|nr:DUF614 FAMILY PROTEIN-RELATED [Salix purpurea]